MPDKKKEQPITKTHPILAYLRLLRPGQWIKNAIIYIPLFFSGYLFTGDYFLHTIYAFVALCFLTSSIYIINDIVDMNRDRLHPVKKYRPLASGQASPTVAMLLSAVLFVIAIFGGYLILTSEYFLLLQLAYFFMMLLYSVWLKNVVIIDTIVIAMGFILRIFAGAILLQIVSPAMLVLTIIGASLLLSFGKRRSEISIMSHANVIKYRPVMGQYPPLVLDLILAGLFAITFMSYTLFCYSYTGLNLDPSLTQILPPLLRSSKWLLATVPIAFYALARYLLIVYRSDIAEQPENIWMKDRGLFVTLLFWGLIMYFMIYL